MELELFSNLYERIQLEPSVLLLGQNYSLIGNGKDPVWEKLCSKIYPELNLPRKKVDYPTLWEKTVETPEDAQRVISQIAEAGSGIAQNPAVSTVARLRWSLLYTSAIDDTGAIETERGYSPIPPEERTAKSMYLNKERRFRVNLCGSKEYPPPPLNDKISQKSFNRKISNKIAWISNYYLEYYGVLVIEGLDPEYDWLNDTNLFEQLIEMPPHSVFWFSAPDYLEENATLLVERGILTTDEDSLYNHLLRHIPELMERSGSESEGEQDSTLYASLTLRLSDRQTHTAHIRRSDIADITGSNLCVIDDEIMSGNFLSGKSRAQKFADFLTQEGLPSWHLFDVKSGEEPFYIPRDQDKALEKTVYTALKDTSSARKPVILSGPSNSGKSIMLANLALLIAKRRKLPVVFIRGDMISGAETRLEKFLGNWFSDPERFGGERPEKVVVIWDGSGLRRTEKDYDNLQKLLFSRNAQVVGSIYSSKADSAIKLAQNLSPKEEKQLDRVLYSLGEIYTERFKEVRRRQERAETLKNSSLLYLLQAVFKYEFDDEYRDLAKILKQQFKEEKQFAEYEASQGLQDYVDSFFETQKRRAKEGLASSFKARLQQILDQMATAERESSEPPADDVEGEKQRKMEQFKHLSKCISDINDMLAVASEFGVQLPLHLLLKSLRDEKGYSYVSYGEEPAKIIEILRTDTLINFTYRSSIFGEEYYVGFRNTIEAENYICLLCDLPLESRSELRQQKEIEILKRIIDTAESEIDLYSVIELVRQFGPNGHGMLSEIGRKTSDYLVYKEYWLEIAQDMLEHFPDDPETALLYAHLTREYISQVKDENPAYFDDIYQRARTVLETALDKVDDTTAQYDRLSVELCANYQQTLRKKFNLVFYNSIKSRIRNAFRTSRRGREAIELRRDFSSNHMLDILLNAYSEFRKSPASPEEKRVELEQILFDIDDMLNLDDLIYEKKDQDLIRKVKEVYEQLGSDSKQMEKLKANLLRANSDAFLYLQARMLWQEGWDIPEGSDATQSIEFLDRYMVICRDIPYSRLELSKELVRRAQKDAEKVIRFLEDNDEMVQRAQSERCIAMLLRAKWFLKTGNPMLAEKQCVALTRGEWDEISRLCDRYHTYHKGTELFIPAYFLKGVYEWVYGSAVEAREWFKQGKSYARNDNSARSIERLVLCKEGTAIPRTFVITIQRNEFGNYTAQIVRETTPNPVALDEVAIRYGMGASDNVVKYLFDGTMPKEQRQQAKRDGVIRFNLIGAQIGIPQAGGMSND